jgi:hypothetical protein
MRFLILLALLLSHALADIEISSDFPGGSARVLDIDQKQATIRLVPQPAADRGWPCWWYFRADGLEIGKPVRIQVGGMTFAKPLRAAFSTDQKTWQHSEAATRDRSDHVYTLTPSTKTMWFAWGPPFQLADAHATIATAAKMETTARPYTLCTSREGHEVPAIAIGTGPQQVWIHARQHAWECGSSWVAKGLLEWLISDPAASLRKAATIHLVPVMDVDSVERGAGGKDQQPQDHNRDWSETPHWPEVRAAQQKIKALMEDDRLALFVDLHNPAPGDMEPFFYLPPEELLSEAQQPAMAAFIAAAKAHMGSGPIAFNGRTRVSGKNYDRQNWMRISKNWVAAQTSGRTVAVTLETAWNTPHNLIADYENFGAALGQSIDAFLRPTAE